LIDFLKEGRVGAATLLCCGNDSEFVRADRHANLRWDFSPARKRRFGEVKLQAGETEVSICNYVIAARLHPTNAAFQHTLMESGKIARCEGDVWVLRSKLTVQQLRQKLSMVMHKDEQVVIVNASKDRLAWINLGPESDIAVRDAWDSDEVV
jgi:iron-sulfur cluster repair protein YtfE (RIC family)